MNGKSVTRINFRKASPGQVEWRGGNITKFVRVEKHWRRAVFLEYHPRPLKYALTPANPAQKNER